MPLTCSCCGKPIEEGALDHTQLAAVDALDGAVRAFGAAAETRLKAVVEPSKVTLERMITLLDLLVRQAATAEQKASLCAAVERAGSLLRAQSAGPS